MDYSDLSTQFLGLCFFQYNLNSRFSICNRGQTSSGRLFRAKKLLKSFCLLISIVATGFNFLPSSWQMKQKSWPITLRCKPKLLQFLTPLICRLLFTSGQNKFIVLSFADSLFSSFFLYLQTLTGLSLSYSKLNIAFSHSIYIYGCHKKASHHF